jgi:hypothetical protein
MMNGNFECNVILSQCLYDETVINQLTTNPTFTPNT